MTITATLILQPCGGQRKKIQRERDEGGERHTRQTGGQTDRDRGRARDRHTLTQTVRQTDRSTKRETDGKGLERDRSGRVSSLVHLSVSENAMQEYFLMFLLLLFFLFFFFFWGGEGAGMGGVGAVLN